MISVICPTFNEIKYIERVLNFFVTALPQEKEFLIIDGGSDDGTIDVVKKWIDKNNKIRLIHNPDKIVAKALNIGIKECKGDIIIRIDAHCKYAQNYFVKILETFASVDADIVGGPTRIAFDTPFQEALGVALTSGFGIGDSNVHNINYTGYSDHVTFGAWKKEIFKDIGFFDERLIRDQDDEFHYRAKMRGKKIYLNSQIQLWYYPRNSLTALFKQYLQYGLYKPLVLKKNKSEAKPRHFIPSLFTINIFVYILNYQNLIIALPLLMYLVLLLYYSVKKGRRVKKIFYLFFTYPVIHISYGTGFLLGLFKILFDRNWNK